MEEKELRTREDVEALIAQKKIDLENAQTPQQAACCRMQIDMLQMMLEDI